VDDLGQAPSPAFPTLTRAPQVSVSIAELILDRISSGSVPVGARLPGEVALAREFGVSRPSVREALAALQFAGYVESRRGFGTVVISRDAASAATAGAAPTRRPLVELGQAIDLLETRLVLEPHALAVAAIDPDRGALAEAQALIRGMRVAVDEPGLPATTDITVHRALLRVCRNVILRESATELLDLALDPMLSTARTQAWASPDLPHVWADQHDVVCAAISAGDPDAARAGSLAHLGSVVDNLAAATAHEPALERRIRTMTAEVGITRRPALDTRVPAARRDRCDP
jgi:DNA-binding FadR family transcriptional regulator